ncbi:hypothetical protein [Arabidopsis thaliana]|uniref:Uncharacterized protein F5M6.4 n=1 Tax=Arabidopsis thaliana TaxID=3702 RepID=Q9C555_ARATH|nr:uncharacterized protein AT1G31960 [Arabidopsis thaliana]AAG50726.1 hypothetical protein [Arabidopsis thaliana]AAG50786.1 hypothetical protein [Arabidopsis thaliana]AEE31422.1 hypothetical protein AT1G31960 [Arabidopsis thaliana]|eukprot:NP_174478.1 hypothetical protein AT1G31960 [Arabidopsis thaliana]
MDAKEDVRPTGRGGRGVTAKSHVIVTSNMSVRQFLDVKYTTMNLNLFLSLDPIVDDNQNTLIKKDCSGRVDKDKGIVGDAQVFYTNGFKMSAMVTKHTNRSYLNNPTSIRRKLFDDAGVKGSNGVVRFHSVETSNVVTISVVNDFYNNEMGDDGVTNVTGIIRLARSTNGDSN